MATYNKFQDFIEQVWRAKHDFGSHTFKVALTNTAPAAGQTGFAPGSNHPPPAAANGYTSGGATMTVGVSESGGTLHTAS